MHDSTPVTKGYLSLEGFVLTLKIQFSTCIRSGPSVNNLFWYFSDKPSVYICQCWSKGVQKKSYLQNSINVYFLWFIWLFYLYNIEKCILWIGLVNINLIFLLLDVNRTIKWTLAPFPIIFYVTGWTWLLILSSSLMQMAKEVQKPINTLYTRERGERNPSLIFEKACSKQNRRTKSIWLHLRSLYKQNILQQCHHT